MPLNDAAVRRLAALGITSAAELDYWRKVWDADGAAFVGRYLDKLEADSAAYRQWFPRLHDFAARCRREHPAAEALSAVERDQGRVLAGKMREFAASGDRGVVFDRKPYVAAVVSAPPAALAAADEVFGGAGAVVLAEGEWERWLAEVYPPDGEAFGWYTRAWFAVRTGLSADDDWLRREYPLPAGSEHWVVTSGVAWGSLAGGARHELWHWDGAAAAFVALYALDTY